MGPQDVRLPPELSQRLARRAAELLPLGSLLDDPAEATAEQQREVDRALRDAQR